MKKFKIHKAKGSLRPRLQQKIDLKTKPPGSLGKLEEVAAQIGLIQNTLEPRLSQPHLLVFAGDHGIAAEGVSAYPQEVTWQMVMNFLNGGAAINVFCRQHSITLKVVDAGVNHTFPQDAPALIHNKAGLGTANFAVQPAMTGKQVQGCIDTAAALIREIHSTGCNVIGFGEMGIGNTSSAAVLMSLLCGIPLPLCVGRGTGLNDEALQRKLSVLTKAVEKHGWPSTPLKILATYGGFEIAQMAGAILQAAELGMVVLIDGFIACTAYLVAHALEPAVKEYCIFCHQSREQGHKLLLEHLHVRPLLNLDMRLGEGTGAAVAYPLLQSAVNFLNQMASFESAGVADSNL
jgi:nicotinate-nucleotide--dimethylbenzimidazole phosphoribosyltransferase